MNLEGKGESMVPDDYTRQQRIEEDMVKQYKQKRNKPYNRSFSRYGESIGNDSVVVTRTDYRQMKREAKFRSGFMSWLMGLFTALIVVLLVGAFVTNGEFKSKAEDTGAMIIEENNQRDEELDKVDFDEDVESVSEQSEDASVDKDGEEVPFIGEQANE